MLIYSTELSTYNGMTLGTKEGRLNLRIKSDLKDDARITAELRGIKISQLISMLLAEEVRVEKQRAPESFKEPNRSLTLKVLDRESEDESRPVLKAVAGRTKSKPPKNR